MTKIINVMISDDSDTLEYEVTEILVAVGDSVKDKEVLIVVESEKVSLELCAERSGIIQNINTSIGSKVIGSEVLIIIEESEVDDTFEDTSQTLKEQRSIENHKADVVVIGAGPGGYTAAFRCADLGAKVMLIDKETSLGGTCLNVGCIPSKALLHAAKVIQDAEDSVQFGISFKSIAIDIHKLQNWKESIVKQLTGGIKHLASKRKIVVVTGNAHFANASCIEVNNEEVDIKIEFDHAIIATGSYPAEHPKINYEHDRVLSSENALRISDIPSRLMVIGCGVIGLEMASVYQSLGSKVILVDITSTILFGVDKDLIDEFEKDATRKYEQIYLQAKVTEVTFSNNQVIVTIQKGDESIVEHVDKVLVAIGRKPASDALGLEKIGIRFDDKGFIDVNNNYQTNVSTILAIGDVIGGPMLAHKALYEGKKAAEFCMGKEEENRIPSIPAVVYTDPEIAWVGLSQEQAMQQGIEHNISTLNWSVNGRLLCHGQKSGLTKIVIDAHTNCILGAGIVGPNAGELITEFSLAIDLQVPIEDLSNVIHPHPTFSETSLLALESHLGIATDILSPK